MFSQLFLVSYQGSEPWNIKLFLYKMKFYDCSHSLYKMKSMFDVVHSTLWETI